MDFSRMRRATFAEAGAVSELLQAAGRDLQEQGFLNWSVPYPLEAIRAQIGAGHVWVLPEGDQLLATLTLDFDLPPEYRAEWFTEPQAAAAYLHRLAVRPGQQGRGLGGLGLREAERITRESGREWLRLDCYGRNAALPDFYARQGFTPLREFQMKIPALPSPEPFRLFEKRLAAVTLN